MRTTLCHERQKAPRTGTPNGQAAERGFFVARIETGGVDDEPADARAQKIEDKQQIDAIKLMLSRIDLTIPIVETTVADEAIETVTSFRFPENK